MLGSIIPPRESDAIVAGPNVTRLDGKRAIESWALPLDPHVLAEFFRYIFSEYWDNIIFGPIIEGAAYEMTCPSVPHIAGPDDGYLTIGFGAAHFHLCVGGHTGRRAHLRQPSRAELYRRLDSHGAPISWGFQMENGAGHPMISIFLPSPFVTMGDRIEPEPLWERLHLWHDLTWRYLGLAPDEFDRTGTGYIDGNY